MHTNVAVGLQEGEEGVLPLVSLLGGLVTVLVGVLIVFTLARILPGVVARPLVRLMLSRKHRNTIPQVRCPLFLSKFMLAGQMSR
jgi:hypothetical protein